MGAPTTVGAISNSFTDEQMAQIEQLRSEEMVAAHKLAVRLELASGKITNEQAAEKLEGIDRLAAGVEGRPLRLRPIDQKTAFQKESAEKALEKQKE